MVCKPAIFWTYEGETLSIYEWSDRTGIPYQTLYKRRELLQLSLEQTFGHEPMPKRPGSPIRIIKTSDGREGTYEQWSAWTGLPVNTLKKRLVTMKWSEDRTVNTPRQRV